MRKPIHCEGHIVPVGVLDLCCIREIMNSNSTDAGTIDSQWESRTTGKAIWCFLLILFSLGCAKHFATFCTGPTRIENDAVEYWERGGRVAQGDLLQVREAVNFRGPLYTWLIGGCRWAAQEYGLYLLAILQHLMSFSVAILTAWMCWDLTRRKSAVVIGYAIAIAGVTSTWYANVVLTEILFQFVFTVCVWMMIRYHRHPNNLAAMGFGAFLALAILTRPIPKLLWIPLIGIFLCHGFAWMTAKPLRIKHIAMHMLACAVPMFMLLAPWSVRNYFYFEDGSVAALPPINKWVVCFHGKSGGDLDVPVTTAGNTLRVFLPEIDSNLQLRQDGYEVIRQLRSAGLSERAVDLLITEVCYDAIANNPKKFFWQTFKRFGNYWRCTVKEYPYYSSYSEVDGPLPQFDAGSIPWRYEPLASWYESVLRHSLFTNLRFTELYSLICWIGVLYLLRNVNTRIVSVSIACIFLYFAGVTAALEIENYRYRMVLEPAMNMVIACWISACVENGFHPQRSFSKTGPK